MKKNGLEKEVVILVLELAVGGELFDFMMYTGAFSEVIARTYFRQVRHKRWPLYCWKRSCRGQQVCRYASMYVSTAVPLSSSLVLAKNMRQERCRCMPLLRRTWYLFFVVPNSAPSPVSCVQMLSALEMCHSTGIAHRDIKPENILLDNNFQLRMADFGLSSIMEVIYHTTRELALTSLLNFS